jgi:superfamily II DNA or RNA helicase
MGKAELVADIVNTWLTKARGLPTLCFCVNRAHAQKVAEQFSSAGVRTAYVDANTPREERDAIGKRLAAGEVEVVCNIGCLTTGVDWDVRCISLCRPTKSEMLFVQIIGRGLRPADGKADCLVLDHSDTTIRLGMVTDIDHDELDDGKPKPKSKAGEKEEKEKLPKECQECAGLIPYGAKECPCCGAIVRRPANVEQREGELVELTPGSMKPKGKRIPVLEQLREMGERSIYGQLRSLQAERDKSDGWVAANFKAVFDKWPPRRWDVPIEPEEPSYALRSWIKARSIAYAKAMEAKNSARNGVML